MKSRLVKLFLSVVVFVMAVNSSSLFAQDAPSVDNSPKLAELARKLSFSDQQKKQLDALLEKYQQDRKEIQTQAVKLQVAMRSVDVSELTEETVARLSNLSGKVVKAHTYTWLNTQREFYRMLNARQKNEYQRLREANQKASKNK